MKVNKFKNKRIKVEAVIKGSFYGKELLVTLRSH
jgi:hypothetical protein